MPAQEAYIEYGRPGDDYRGRWAYRNLGPLPRAQLGVSDDGTLHAITTVDTGWSETTIAVYFEPDRFPEITVTPTAWREESWSPAYFNHFNLYRTYASGSAQIHANSNLAPVTFPEPLRRDVMATYREAMDQCAQLFAKS